MISTTHPTKPVDAAPAVKADPRANLQSAKDEIEALQAGNTELGQQHTLADVTDSGALASKDVVLATAAPNAIDVYGIITRDGGTTWYGFPGDKDFS